MADSAFVDVESQASSASSLARAEGRPPPSGGKRRAPIEEWVGTTLTPAKEVLWTELIGTKPVGPSGHYNPHGMLAAQRYVAEKEACELLLANRECVVVDVGGAPHRTFEHLGDRGRYQMPQIVAGDRTRRGRCPPGAAEYVCSCRFEECPCWEDGRLAYLFTHSAYYVNPYALWWKLRRDQCVDCISVEHYFPDMFGGFYGEASWAYNRDVITMTCAGNDQPYIHLATPWQRGWVGTEGERFEYETLKSLDNCTRIVRVAAVKSDMRPDEPLIWGEVEADPNKTGPVQFSSAVRNAVADNARFTQVTFDIHKIRKFGPCLYTDFLFRGETVQLTVPCNAVSQVAAIVVNRPRTPELFAEVSYQMKNRLARGRIPPSQLPATLSAVIALGFVVNLQNEMDLIHTMTDRFSWAMKAHTTLLQFGSVAVRWWPWLLLVASFMIAGAATGASLEDEEWQRWLTVAGALLLVVLLWGCFRGVLGVTRAYQAYVEAGWVSSYADDDSPRVPLLGHATPVTRSLPLPGSRYVKPIPEKIGAGRLQLGATREKVSEPNRALVSGIVMDGALPNVLATTQQAEHSAVANRILAPRENPDEGALKELAACITRPEFTLVPSGVDTSLEYFQKWLVKLAKTYPKQYVDGLKDLWLQYQGVEATEVATKGFMKVEKAAAAVKTDHAKPTKPRLVQPPEDVDKAVTGPVVWQLWDKIRRAWDGVKCGVMYCSGYTCAEIGMRVDAFLAEHPDVVGVSLDMASYDSTLALALQQCAFAWYNVLGMAKWLTSWLTRVRTRGTTPNGVTYLPTRKYWFEDEADAKRFAAEHRALKFKVLRCKYVKAEDMWLVEVEDFQMASGRMDTNLTDTVLLTMAILTKMPAIPYLLLVCGDDGFLLLRKQDAAVVESLLEFCRKLGMKPEAVVSDDRSKWEFCSKLFWFAEVQPGVHATVLGSKPFRGIARMGVNTTVPGAANAAAAALSVRIESGHVPFLGPFADRTYELCKESRMRPTGRVEWSAFTPGVRYPPSHLNYWITQARYGLGQENEKEFKARLATLTGVPIVMHYLPVQDALLVDEA